MPFEGILKEGGDGVGGRDGGVEIEDEYCVCACFCLRRRRR